jgi:hypothetical protein
MKSRTRPRVAHDRMYPYWAHPSRRAWARLKRQQLRAALKALHALSQGCAFMPRLDDGKYLQSLEQTLREYAKSERVRAFKR